MLGAIIGAAGSALGSLLGKGAADKANKTQAKMAAQNIAMQKEFAQHGVRWKVEDAKRAGLHPLAALGIQPASFSPVSVGTHTADYSGIGTAGQEIGRAIDAKRTHGERQEANGILSRLAVERAGLENDLLRSQIAKANQAGTPPALPSLDQRYLNVEGQGDGAKLIEQKPMEQTPSDPRQAGQEPGAVVDVGWSRHPNGRYYPVPSQDMKQRMEDQMVPQAMWSLRNFTPGSYLPPPFPAPPGQHWAGNRYTGYYLEKGGLAGLRARRR